MKNVATILEIILSKNSFDYVLIDRAFNVILFSPHVSYYVGTINEGSHICDSFPELVGSEPFISNIFEVPTQKFSLKSVAKNKEYIHLSIEFYAKDVLLLLVHNITESTMAKQKILQHSNESILLSTTLEKILNKQHILLFLTQNDHITFSNRACLEYFKVDSLEALQDKKIKLYQYVDHALKGYDDLFNYVNYKEVYVVIDNDTFILQVSMLEATHKLFTLSKITDISKKLQYDALTNTYKKEYFHQEVEKLILLEHQAVIMVIDIDNFKEVNARYGYERGNKVLQDFASLIDTEINDINILARWGGEAFLLLCKDTTLEEAYIKAKTLCLYIETYVFEKIGHMTASFGLSEISEKDTLHSVLLRADKALYEAKKAGKNMVVMKKINKR